MKVAAQAVAATGARWQRRAVIIRFSLSRPAVVRFVITREAPLCAWIGAFAVRGNAGPNRVRFTGRFRGAPLAPGTYSLSATALRARGTVSLGRVRVVVLEPGMSAVRARPAPSTCAYAIGASVARAEAALAGSGIFLSGGGTLAAIVGEPSSGGGGSRAAAALTATAESGEGGVASAVSGARPDARDGRILRVLADPFRGAPAVALVVLGILGASALLLAAASSRR